MGVVTSGQPFSEEGEATLAAALAALESEKVSKREEAIRALADMNGPDTVERVIGPLAERLAGDKNDQVRALVADCLKTLGSVAISPLIEALVDPHQPVFVRVKAAHSLGELRAVPAQQALLAEALRGGSDMRIAFACLRAIGQIDDAEGTSALASSLQAIKEDSICAQAVTIVGRIGRPADAAHVEKLLASGSVRTLKASATALRSLLGDGAVRPLSRLALTSSDASVRERAVAELAALPAGPAWEPLVRCLVLDESIEVRMAAAGGLAGSQLRPDAVALLLRTAEEAALPATAVDATLVTTAFSGSRQALSDGTTVQDRLIEEATRRPKPWPYLAALLRATCGDSARAGEAVNAFAERQNTDESALQWLRIELGGREALDPILEQLRSDLHTYFQIPVHTLNEQTRSQWIQLLADARVGFRVRLIMSGAVFVIGALLLLAASWQFLYGSLDASQAWGTGVSFVGGITAMLAVVYSGPFRNIGEAVRDLAASNAVFIAYVHRVLQASHTFSGIYLHDEMTLEAAEKTSELIRAAMEQGVAALDAPSHAEEKDA